MYPKNLNDITDPATRKRIGVERRIVLSLIDELLGHGYALSVYDGEEKHPWTTDRQAVIDVIMETGEDWLRVALSEDFNTIVGSVCLVYGNDGWDVMSDYTLVVQDKIAKTVALAASLED